MLDVPEHGECFPSAGLQQPAANSTSKTAEKYQTNAEHIWDNDHKPPQDAKSIAKRLKLLNLAVRKHAAVVACHTSIHNRHPSHEE
jgi:hypothetical protein